MKVITEEHYIPEKRYTTTKYIASDGRDFTSESACLAHEKQLEILNHPVVRSAVLGVTTFGNDNSATMYFISSEADYDFMFKNVIGVGKYSRFYSDFDVYGPGWYLYWCESGGDYDDYHNLVNYNAYVEEIEDDIRLWKGKIERAVGDRFKSKEDSKQ